MIRVVLLAVFMLLSSFGNNRTEISGVATWSEDNGYEIVGINKTEMESGFFGITEERTSSSLFLCDKNVKPLDTLFKDRDLGGVGCKIINLYFDQSQGHILVNLVDQS